MVFGAINVIAITSGSGLAGQKRLITPPTEAMVTDAGADGAKVSFGLIAIGWLGLLSIAAVIGAPGLGKETLRTTYS